MISHQADTVPQMMWSSEVYVHMLPSITKLEANPHILRELLLLTESSNFLKSLRICLVLNQEAASAYVRDLVRTMVQQSTEIDLYTSLILSHLIRALNDNETWDNTDSMEVVSRG